VLTIRYDTRLKVVTLLGVSLASISPSLRSISLASRHCRVVPRMVASLLASLTSTSPRRASLYKRPSSAATCPTVVKGPTLGFRLMGHRFIVLPLWMLGLFTLGFASQTADFLRH
jgi:hypothetical protein